MGYSMRLEFTRDFSFSNLIQYPIKKALAIYVLCFTPHLFLIYDTLNMCVCWSGFVFYL